MEQPADTDLPSGGTKSFGTVAVGGNAVLAFTLKNTGSADLTLSGTPDKVAVSGTDAALFTVTAQPASPVTGPSGSTTFTVRFSPTGVGTKTALLTIANNDPNGGEAPFLINLTGNGVTVQENWRNSHFTPEEIAAGDAADTANPDGDALTNLQEFAFGMDPNVNDSSALAYDGTFADGGTITTTGLPITMVESITYGVDFRALFVRRKDYVASGLAYTPQFSATMSTWQNSTADPTVLADDGTYQIVSVPYPVFIAGKKARYFRIGVSVP